jgi:hypothetical protein
MAARNNAEWCHIVCQLHGVDGAFAGDAWTSPTRTPALYPDAVTLAPDVSVPQLLSRIDVSPGCSVKDSFASLDLTPHGFRVLFDAEWLVRDARTPSVTVDAPPWTAVRDAEAFAGWDRAWRGESGPAGVLAADLIGLDSVLVVAAHDAGRVVAGAILSGGPEVVGISNFFAEPAAAGRASWYGCVALATRHFPNATLVGYESGAAVDLAVTSGFAAVGGLRVWLKDG